MTCERLQISDEELREDVNVLNVVNFGGGSYVLYAEIKEDEGEIEVDPEPYSDEVDPAAEVDGWLRTGEVPASATARVWVSPDRARGPARPAGLWKSGATVRLSSS